MSLRKIVTTSALLLMILLPGSSVQGASQAQGIGGWQPPAQLAIAAADAPIEAIVYAPVIVADGWGNAHAFWQASNSGVSGTIDSSLVYSRWDAAGWSEPVEIFYATRRLLWAPQAAVDSRGQLHLIWENGPGGAIMYAHAAVAAANAAPNWSAPEFVTDSRDIVDEMTKKFVSTPSGELHLVYCTGGERPKIEYTHLTDRWSPPTTVQSSTGDLCRVNLAIDDRGRLHLVYVFSEGEGMTIFYTQSDDQGTNWSPPREIAVWQPDFYPGYGPNFPGIITSGDQIHITWLGYPRTQRWHQWSSDRGTTWSAAVALAPNLLLATDAPGMVIDRTGALHLATIGDNTGTGDEHLHYAVWRNGAWTPLTDIFSEADERAALAVTTDGTLHLIWDNDEGATRSIMVSSFMLGKAAAPLPGSAMPEPAAPPTEVAAVAHDTLPTSAAQQTPLPTVPAMDFDRKAGAGGDSVSVIVISTVAAGAVVALVVLVALRRRMR